jgi:Transposase IS66 family
MSSPSTASLEAFSPAVLRDLVGTLVSEVARLRADNAALQERAEAQRAAIAALSAETQALRDEVARLKGLPPRPPSRPSGMEKATSRGAGKGGKRLRRRRGAKRDRDAVTAEVVVKAAVPAGSRFKGYGDILVRELRLSAAVVRFRRERWVTPAGETVLAPLPAGIVGGFGPELRRFLLVAHAQGQVTTERLTALLNGIGAEISKRQVARLLTSRLDDLLAEDRDVLRAGLATARWVTVDDTAARHARRDGVTTQIGDDRFTAFRTGGSKSREAFLSTLRAGHGGYVVSEAALAYMRGRALAGPVVDLLAAHPAKVFADAGAWAAHLGALGIDRLAVTPDPVRIATEGALWGTIKAHGLLPETAIVSDDAGQFRLGEHALCWVHAERLVHKLVPTTAEQRRAIELTRALIWWFYADLKAWRRDPCPRRAAALRARFERILTRRTGCVMLDRLLARLHRRKRELLRVLERPEIPLHTNGSENDIRACVAKRKISGGTMSEAGRTARDVLLGLMKTCRRLGRPLVLPLPRGPNARPGRHAHPAAPRPRPTGCRNRLIAPARPGICPGYLCIAVRLCRRRTFAGSEPRCTYGS